VSAKKTLVQACIRPGFTDPQPSTLNHHNQSNKQHTTLLPYMVRYFIYLIIKNDTHKKSGG